MLQNRLRNLKNNLLNIPGWRTSRRLVVFESDDWGMIRMASKEAFFRLEKKGYEVYHSFFDQYDALETNEDIEQLIEVLSRFRDKHGQVAKFTMNMVMANPDFEKIKKNKFIEYSYESFQSTLSRYSDRDKVMQLYKEGIAAGVFRMQFHGREHVHINRWITKLRSGDQLYLDAFKEEMYALEGGHLDAMAMFESTDISTVSISIKEGLRLFEDTWGFPSTSVIAPCYTWGDETEREWAAAGVKYIQGARAQKKSYIGKDQTTVSRHYMGEQSKYGMIYMIRNVSFEPVTAAQKDWVNSALKEVDTAFRWGKPAVISTHRINYIGALLPENRKRNLHLLFLFLETLLKKYPDVEFVSSDELGQLISGDKL
ncbi:hypothetical protein MM213_01020 [Belliella sp. R4-6]|uniref:Polysaccharide deacetylase n=1 Tax=Belliella alkalica TaxID=1730871 RepID=A0ABS9V6P8_9BACT|nr:hypothetical protein [Belliella alkalica]MCH7412048.1 hypothetical protein [Belliella alkalica]